MLNRRTLRIKAMQSLFAYERRSVSNFDIAKDRIAEAFTPNLNSMEVQDKELLKSQKKEATDLFKAHYLSQDITKHCDQPEIIQVLANVIDQYNADLQKDEKSIKNMMIDAAEKLVNQYAHTLMLLPELADIATNDKKYNTSNFVNNLLIKAIKRNKSLENIILRYQLGWKEHADELKEWYRRYIRNTDEFRSYLSLDLPTFAQDYELVEFIIKNAIFKSEEIANFMEKNDLYWSENKSIIKSMVLKTIKSITSDNEDDFDLAELSYNWEDDKDFFEKIYTKTLSLDNELKDLIANKSKNWDVKRLASVDRIIMEMAITEMLNFPSIPVKVTINEYIELAKNYSTPKSKQFINGMLDNISKELISNGTVRKSGRGLIDNK